MNTQSPPRSLSTPEAVPHTKAGRELLDHTVRLDYDAYDAGRAFMEERGGGDWAEAIIAIESEAREECAEALRDLLNGKRGAVKRAKEALYG